MRTKAAKNFSCSCLATMLLLGPISSRELATAAALSGGLAEEPKLAPIERTVPLLIAGLQFDESMLSTPEAGNNSWYWIPSWFAGTWHRESVVVVSRYDYRTATQIRPDSVEKAISDDEEGWQKDAHGEHWSCVHTPFSSDCFGDHCRQIFVVTSIKPLEVTQDRVVKLLEGTGVVIEDGTGVIMRATRAKSIQTYHLLKPGLMTSSSVTTEFDGAGNPTSAIQTTATLRKTAEFHDHNFHAGKDMRISFKNFLSSRGQSNQAPIETSSLPAAAIADGRQSF